MNRRFLSIHTREAIEVEVQNAEASVDNHGTLFPDSTYEDGVESALRWILGLCGAPMDDSDQFAHYRGQVINDQEAGEQRYVAGSLLAYYEDGQPD